MPKLSTRARAWALRTFKGRTREEAGWEDESTWVSSPPEVFRVGELEVGATPVGVKAAGDNRPSAVYEVRVGIPGDSRSWSSRYGLAASDNSARAAAEIALDELDEIWRSPEDWKARVLAGLSEDEIEAMEDSPAFRLDLRSAQWVGPELDSVRPVTKAASGRWIPGSPG